jgi:SNF2 family DNA or RNA helicase
MIQISHKHGMVAVPFRTDIANLFPHALRVGGSIVIPHHATETRLLRNFGLDVPAPILEHYDWRNGKPFDVQKKTAAMLTTNPRAYVLNGMGTGKTKAALWAWDYLRSTGEANKLLVTAPLSTLNFVWAREVFSTMADRKVQVLYGTKKRRLERLADMDADIYVINHDGIGVIMDELMARTDIDSLVIDELATFRNPTAERTKLMRRLAGRMAWAWGMTGSPIPNEPTDAWAQCSILTPGSIPKRYTHFRDAVMTKVSNFKWVPKRDAIDEVYRVMQPAVRYSLDDVVELPDLIERTVDVEMGDKQAKVYKAMQDHAYAAIAAKEITAMNAGAAMNKLVQIACGWVYTREHDIVPLDNDARLTALSDVVASAERKIIVFVPFKHALAGISERLTKDGVDHAVVSGDVSKAQRDVIFSRFQNTTGCRVLAAHPACMSHGLTLTAADTIVWFAPIADLEIFSQANARIRRIGQKHKQQILMFQGTKVEQILYRKLVAKQKVQNALLQLYEQDN